MARTVGPLMSFDASGSVGKSIVFSKWKGRNYVRRLVTPANPRSGGQVATRAMMTFLSQEWVNASAVTQADFLAGAESLKISAFNFYVQQNQKEFSQYKAPSGVHPYNPISAAPSQCTLSVTGGVGQLTVQVTGGATKPTWGYWLLVSTAAITPTRNQVRQVVTSLLAAANTSIVTQLPPGVYNVKAVPFNKDGVAGTISANATGTVT